MPEKKELIKIGSADKPNLKAFFSEGATSHTYKRQESLLDMAPKQSVIQISANRLKGLVKVLKDDEEYRTHIAFCFATPLKPPDSSKSKADLPLLNYMGEFRGIAKAVKSINKQVRYSKKVATASNFGEVFASNPCVLHFSGHGVKVHSDLRGNGDFDKDQEGDYLVIEDKY